MLTEFRQPCRRVLVRYLLDAPPFRYGDVQYVRLCGEQLINDVADRHARVQMVIATRLQLCIQTFDTRPDAEGQLIANKSFALQVAWQL